MAFVPVSISSWTGYLKNLCSPIITFQRALTYLIRGIHQQPDLHCSCNRHPPPLAFIPTLKAEESVFSYTSSAALARAGEVDKNKGVLILNAPQTLMCM